MVREALDVFLGRGPAGLAVDQRGAVIVEQELIGRGHRHEPLIPVGIAPALIAQIGRAEQPLVGPVEEGRDLVVLLPGRGRSQLVPVLVGKGLLFLGVVEQVGAVVPGLKIAVQRHAVNRSAIAVQQRHARLAVHIAALGVVPLGAVGGDVIVQRDDAIQLQNQQFCKFCR